MLEENRECSSTRREEALLRWIRMLSLACVCMAAAVVAANVSANANETYRTTTATPAGFVVDRRGRVLASQPSQHQPPTFGGRQRQDTRANTYCIDVLYMRGNYARLNSTFSSSLTPPKYRRWEGGRESARKMTIATHRPLLNQCYALFSRR